MEFIDAPHLINAYTKQFDTTLIALSIIIAITSSFTAFGIVERINTAEKKYIQAIWIIFGATAMGLGFWSMHFIGSLAVRLPIPVSYNLQLTLLSMVPAILVSSAVLWLMMQTEFNQVRLLLCGIFLGLGICNMHFIGMMSLQFDAKVYYIATHFFVAVIIAILFATAALYIQFAASTHSKIHVVGVKQLKSSIVLGFAVSGMYYIIMHTTVFLPWPGIYYQTRTIDADILAYIISVVILLILLLAIITPLALRYRQLTFDLRQQKKKLTIATTAFQARDAIMITNEKARIIRINDAFTQITGYNEKDVLGKTPKILQSGKHNRSFYKELWRDLLNEEQWSGEICNKRKNGELFPCWQTISTIRNEQGETTHYISFFTDISKFKENEKQIERLAFYDPLTDLPNRRLLTDHLEYEFSVAKRYHRNGALLFLDLDRFKHINDSLGHSVGDEILKITAQRLQSILRKSDTAVRLGGDEYIILIPAQDKTSDQIASQAQNVAKKIKATVNKPYHIGNHDLFISTSIGITLFNGEEENPDTILKQADTAMYQAKDAGRNTFRFYLDSMQEAVDTRLILEKSLRTACINNELDLHYQVQFSFDKEIVGAEALLRWNHPELGIISPANFISIAEETGLIVEMGEWVLKTACAQLKVFDRNGINIPHIAVNISLSQFRQANFVSMVENIAAKAKIKPERVLLEITESVFLKNFDDAIAKMNALKQCGFRFSIDDFGTGYSSLTFLKRLPFDELKIDQSFIHDLTNSPNDTAIVKAIILMTNSMGLDLIAEGVENEQQLNMLFSYGCHVYQGHHFSKPLPADEFMNFCKKHLASHPII